MLELSVDIERLTWRIYIGKINQTESGEGKAQLFYHIPIDTPVSGIMPIPESAIAAQIEQTEIDALAAASLVEVLRNIVIFASQTQTEIADTIRTDWQDTKADYNDKNHF